MPNETQTETTEISLNFARYQPTTEELRLLKQVAGGGELDQDEFNLFLSIARQMNLNPFTGQIVAVKRYSSRDKRKNMILQTTLMGMRAAAQRTGEFDGVEGPLWTEDGVNWVDVWLSDKPPKAARATVRRKGVTHPENTVATWSQSAVKDQAGNLTHFYQQMPAHMLGKCAVAMGYRAAFPELFSGVFAAEELGAFTNAQGKIEQPQEEIVDGTVEEVPPPAVGEPKSAEPAAPDSAVDPAEVHQREIIARLFNSIPRERRPATEVIREYGRVHGRPGQIRLLGKIHGGVCDPPCEHWTKEYSEISDFTPDGWFTNDAEPGAATNAEAAADQEVVPEASPAG
jgi:phage recombination protein Bet